MKNNTLILLYLGLTLGISFAAAGLFRLAGGDLKGIPGTVLGAGYMLIPALVSVFIELKINRQNPVKTLFLSFRFNRWFFIAWLLVPLISLASFGIALLFPGVEYSPEMEGMFARFGETLSPEKIEEMKLSIAMTPVSPLVLTLVQGMIAGVTLNALLGLGEELGWRGFLLRRAENRNFLPAALFTGAIWGFWHFPLILMGHNYPQHPVAGVFMMAAWCILLSPSFMYFTIKARSVVAAAVMHGTLNGTVGLGILYLKGGNDLTVGTTGLAGFAALALFNTLLFIYDRYISRERIMTGKINFS